MKRVLTALLLSSAASAALAQTGVMPASLTTPAPAEGHALTTLVRQAERWLAQGRPDLAQLSAARALAADPANIDALLVAARIETSRNNREGALGYLRRATAAGGSDDQRQAAAAAQRNLSLDQVALDQARRLAREGRNDEASARYRTLFGTAGPAPDYAREYYQALAGSAGTRAEGIAGLSRLADAPDADAATRLASAAALTYQEATRTEGIGRLQTLVGRPETSAAAQQSWRQALGFLGNDPAAATQIEAYLTRFPNDSELSQRLEAMRRAPAADTKQDALRREGFAQLDAGSLRASADRFAAALAANPADADALGGLGLVRLRENKPDEARALLERAIAADPSRAVQWQKALDGAAYGAALVSARVALRRGDPAAADAVLRDALRRDIPDPTDAESLLGEVALAQGDPAGAEQRFRRALARRPGFPQAANGLNQALRAQGRIVEPVRTQASGAPSDNAPAPPRANDRAGQLQAEAAQTTDAAVAVTLLRSAVDLAPLDPWPRLDLARALKRQGRGPEGRALVEELAARSNTADAHFAAALLAQEDGRPDDADSQLGAIATNRRTPDMSRLQARIRTERDIARAASPNAGGRPALMAIATRPDPSGSTGAAVIRALGNAGDRSGAVEASRVALAANTGAGPAARLAIAGALLAADADTDAAGIADQLNAAALTGDQRRDLASLRGGIAIRASDRLNESGAQAQAFERLRPVLADNPDNPDGQLALARLYQGARQPAEALALAQSVLARDPRNFAARQGAVDAAIALGDRRTAQILVADAQSNSPNDSRLTYLQARVATSSGNSTRAQALLQLSLEQRQAELGTDPAQAAGTRATDVSNPFLRGTKLSALATATPTNDPLTRQIMRDLKAAEIGNTPQVSFAPTLHTRSGSPGLDQLTALGATIEGQIAAPGIGGRLVVKADPVLLNSGQIGSTLATLQRFGTNPVLSAGAVTPKNVSMSAVGLGIGYNLRDVFKLSAGTSPLGFKTPSLIGAIEVAPRLTDTLRLRVTADRHAITDSLLSWAGLTDPSSKITWGSVVSSGGRGQIEGPLGAGSFYVGGGYAMLTGQHVASNNRTEAGTGMSYPLLKDTDGELTAGVDLVYFGFANNQRAYTVGNGGYFSPQSYGAINVPLDFRAKSGDLEYRVGVTAGYATFRENSNAVFPNNADLQRQLERAAASNALLITRTPALTRNGFVGGVRVDLAYQLTPTLSLAGSLRYDQAPQFDETNVMVKLQSKF